jgi:hypothetical protein
MPPFVQPLKSFPAHYRPRTIVTSILKALHWSLFWARSLPSVSELYIFLTFISILFIHLLLNLLSGLFPPGFLTIISMHYSSFLFALHILPILLWTVLKLLWNLKFGRYRNCIGRQFFCYLLFLMQNVAQFFLYNRKWLISNEWIKICVNIRWWGDLRGNSDTT